MRRFLLQKTPVVGSEVLITGQDAKHITLVLRLKPGDDIILLTGNGQEYSARIRSIGPDGVRVDISAAHCSETDPVIKLTVALGFLKEKKMDDLVRQLTELGMHRFQPFFARRSVSRPDEARMAGRVVRWEKIARESLKQCRRGSVPEIRPAVAFDEALSLAAEDNVKIVFWERETRFPIPGAVDVASDKPLRVTVLLGPEGGLTDEEVSAARSAGFVACSLGPRILRAETAAVAACALVQYVYGDMGGR
jgi:16S rRNA (uracil1498-N3)-methyltransferase